MDMEKKKIRVKYLKSYNKLFESENSIHKLCKEYEITDYIINDDGSIDVDRGVDLSYRSLTKLPLKFRNVSGDFYCSDNELTSLEGCPRSVGGDFWCFGNELTSLEGSPSSVGGDFWCFDNKLTSLEGCPSSVGGSFYCSGNPCYPIYKEWIRNREIRKELLDMMEDYDFLRGSTIIWNRLESFFEDNDLKIPSKEELSKNYKII
jgi:hypothetical protein